MIKKDVIIGFIVGLLGAITGIALFAVINGIYNNLSIQEAMDQAWSTDFLGKRASLGALVNLPLFYLFLNKKKDDRARGVLMATIMIAIIFIVNKF